MRDQTILKDALLVKKFLHQMLSAIAYFHALNILHRDLKPQNVLVDLTDKKVKVADFGLAKDSCPVLSNNKHTFEELQNYIVVLLPGGDFLELANEFPNLEPAGLDLLSKMLCVYPNHRISAEDALEHEFFNGIEMVQRGINTESYCRLFAVNNNLILSCLHGSLNWRKGSCI
ncbi:hypothetical protein L6164_026537 [Bauhinia variegata]|uniref:Uncharacterized protein n=1 Tax=Bauhinia variegata TaxID=167791 RepID=A0ACB9LRE6_BAUVA|nr:hypothetical protein L6164_026537 [Bauhinia variegata]